MGKKFFNIERMKNSNTLLMFFVPSRVFKFLIFLIYLFMISINYKHNWSKKKKNNIIIKKKGKNILKTKKIENFGR